MDFRRYQELQQYIGWTDADAQRVASTADLLAPYFSALIDDFYAAIQSHAQARKVVTGGVEQVTRLKGTLRTWLRELLSGRYDEEYVQRRWRIGWRHVEIGLEQIYTSMALSRLRRGLLQALEACWHGDPLEAMATRRSLNLLLDLDLTIIQEAYQAEYTARQQRVERWATLGQVAGGIAHELRNPLNVIKTSVYYLLNARQPSPEKTAEHLARIERQVSLADGVITALSSFARLPMPNLQAMSIAQCVQEALEAAPAPAGVELSIDCPADLPAALADLAQIQIVLANIIRNGCEAMPQGGRLHIAARAQADKLEIAVTDTGVGITPENLSRIMEPLFSTKARGLGLGLAIARSILDKNCGCLRVASQPGQGATFTIQLPAAPV